MKSFAANAAIVFAMVAGFISPVAAWDQNPFDQYIARQTGVTRGAGDAKDRNAAIQTVDPWPRYVGDTRIPGNATRLSGAIRRYENNVTNTPRPIRPCFSLETGAVSTATCP